MVTVPKPVMFVTLLVLGLLSACCTQSASEEATTMVTDSRLEQITLTICRKNTDCSFSNSICSDAYGAFRVCQCKDEYVLTGSSVCTSVSLFKVTNLTLKNVTEDSIVVEWNANQNFPGVMIYYTVTFDGSVNSNVSSPYLIKNISDGEVHSVQIKSNVRGRDGREATVKSDVKLTRTVPRAPEFVRNHSYAAPSATISWNPRNLNVKMFYVTLTGPGVSFSNVTNKTSITYNGLGPGRNYTVTVVQQTNEPYATNSSKASFEFHTNSTEPGPPKAIKVIKVEQRKISLNITDTDTPNGDIAGYVFKLRYQIYPDTEYMEQTTFLPKTASSIYDLQHYIVPGVTYKIAVFTRNNAFNSSSNFTLDNVTTWPDIPGTVSVLDPQQTNQTIASGFIRWGRPASPNGNMKAYRVFLNGRPNITCRFYFLCIGMCNDTLLGPPNDICVIQNDTTLVENQREMSLLVDNLRVGTTYTLSVVGYTEAGAGNLPRHVTLRTLSIVPAAVNANSFQISFSSTGATNFNLKWDAPAFPGEDLKYQVTLSDQLKDVTLDTRDTSSPAYSPSSSVRSVRIYNHYKYSIVVTPITSAGTAYGQTYSFITPSKGLLGRPQSLQIDMLPDDCENILIVWTEANIEARNGPITQYIFDNRDGTDVWTYSVPSPNYWAVTNRKLSFKLSVREQATYSLRIYAKNSNQTGLEYTTQRFQTNKCLNLFKVTNLTLKNVTEDSIVVEWNANQNFPGVMVNYTVTFNGSVKSNVSSPYLIKNLSDGEVHSVQITSNVRGRDGREATVMSDVKLTRTVPRAPEFVRNHSYAAPSATISWNPRNPDVKMFYVTLTGPGVSFSNVTNKTSIAVNGLRPGRNYTVTVVQQTNEPCVTNSSKATFEFHTNSTEPGPPKAIKVIEVEQRKISLNITDTDTPNGDIAGYVFKLRYQIYPDTEYMEQTTFLPKTASSIYDLQHYIVPGVTYKIAVFTRNNAFNSSSNFTLDNVTTWPDIPGMVSVLDPQQTNQTIASGFIRWGRPASPNGNMKAYRVFLNGRPNITCRFYFLCIGMCNDTILGPPNDTCVIQNDTTLVENQREMSLLVDNLRVGTTYTLSVVGYTEAGAGNLPRHVTLTTLSIVPAAVNPNSFQISFSSSGATYFNLIWDAPAFPGEDLKYQVILSDQLKYVTLDTRDTSSPAYSLSSSVSSVRLYNYYKYSIVVRSMTSAGSADSRTYSFITPSRGKLGRPQSLQITMLPGDCEHILISWTEANIEARNGPITQYIFENRVGTDKWTYSVPSPNYWTVTNKHFSYELPVQEQATYSLEIYARNSNQTGLKYTTQRFQINNCRQPICHQAVTCSMKTGF